jgi:diguanylate cyclase (GGDEF)-like protein
MPTSDRDSQDLYKHLLSKGVSRQEIEKVYKNLRDRGYGEEEAKRRSSAMLSRLKSRRDLSERRTASRSERAKSALASWGLEGAGKLDVADIGPEGNLKRRAMDWLPPLAPRLRRKINRWAFARGFKMARLSEIVNDLLGIFDKSRKDYASREFLKLLGERRGFLVANPFDYSLIDTVDALRYSSRRLLGGGLPARRIMDRERARNVEQEVRRSLGVREPFALELFGPFCEPSEMLRRSLEYVWASLKADLRVEVSALARVVKEAYRMILITEGIEAETLDALFDVVKEVNLVHDKRANALAELSDAETLFRAAFQDLAVFKHELYPALLKMIASFYEEDEDTPLKKSKIFAFLDLRDENILTYEGFQQRLAEMREKALREQKEKELERLEQEKLEKFSYRFEGTLATLSALFPDSGIERVEQGEFVLPYFMNRVFSRHPILQRRTADLEILASGDVMSLIIIVHMIVDDLLDSVDGYRMETILARDGLGTVVASLRDDWKDAYGTLFEPYLDEIHELSMETSGDPRYVKIFRESLRARSIEERANRLRNHAIKNFGHLLAERDISDAPELFELAERLNQLLSEIGDTINPDLIDAEDPLRMKLAEDLGSAPVVDFAARSQVGSPDYRPVTRQVRRYVEARYRRASSQIAAIAQVVFFDVFRGIADLYCYLLNDRKSFVAQSSHAMAVAAEEEKRVWIREKEERGRDSLLMLQNRLTEDFPGQFVDILTGLKNKNYFLSELPRRMDKLRAEGKPLTLLMIDIDHFKWVNDELGHPDGDEVLKETAAMILDNIREGDLAVRYGGEEILLAIPSDLHTGIVMAERLRFTQEQNLQLKGAFIGVKLISDERKEPCGTLSIGVADAGGIADMNEGVQRADGALYAAKLTRNKVVFLDQKKQPDEGYTSYEEYLGSSQNGTH